MGGNGTSERLTAKEITRTLDELRKELKAEGKSEEEIEAIIKKLS